MATESTACTSTTWPTLYRMGQKLHPFITAITLSTLNHFSQLYKIAQLNCTKSIIVYYCISIIRFFLFFCCLSVSLCCVLFHCFTVLCMVGYWYTHNMSSNYIWPAKMVLGPTGSLPLHLYLICILYIFWQ